MTRGRRGGARAVLAGLALLLAGCTGSAVAHEEAPLPTAKPGAIGRAPAPAAFEAWKADFRRRALAAGISPTLFDAAFRDVRVNERVLELDRYQPEFVRPIWEYLDRAVSPSRIATGRAKAAEHRALLDAIEARYGVDRGVVLAIWGLESAFGTHMGEFPVVESLATLAWDGRRRRFAEEQLIAALRILQRGDVTPARMVGSWAGAMGHTQFIPTSFEAYAVDFTGDGRRDVWAEDPADALASTANYLARFGWRKGAPVVIEVMLPAGFDLALADGRTARSTAEWEALGVRARRGSLVPAAKTTLLLPAGARGPAFLAYPNFRVIHRYNNATAYALAVALLAAELDPAMRFGLTTALDWPRDARPLTRAETAELQRRLAELGYDPGGVDGIAGPNTRAAVRRFQADAGLAPDGFLSAALLERVRRASGG